MTELDYLGIPDEVVKELDRAIVHAPERRDMTLIVIEHYLAKHRGKSYSSNLRDEALARFYLIVASECA